MLDVKKLLTKVLTGISSLTSAVNNPTSRFDMSSHTISCGSISANTTKADQEATFTKANYFPCALAGFNINNGLANLINCDLYQRSVGSVTVRWSVRNMSTSSSMSPNLYVRILWLKIN